MATPSQGGRVRIVMNAGANLERALWGEVMGGEVGETRAGRGKGRLRGKKEGGRSGELSSIAVGCDGDGWIGFSFCDITFSQLIG